MSDRRVALAKVPAFVRRCARPHVSEEDFDAAVLDLLEDTTAHEDTSPTVFASSTLEAVVGAYFRLWARRR